MSASPDKIEIECRLLAALCDPALAPELRSQIFQKLASHKFDSSDHEIIFRALAAVAEAPIELIRETLAARITRLGFPDIDIAPLLALPTSSPAEIPDLLSKLDS
jgi:hypothetical protein